MPTIYAAFWLILTTASSHGVSTSAVPMPDDASCQRAAKAAPATQRNIIYIDQVTVAAMEALDRLEVWLLDPDTEMDDEEAAKVLEAMLADIDVIRSAFLVVYSDQSNGTSGRKQRAGGKSRSAVAETPGAVDRSGRANDVLRSPRNAE